MAKECVDLLRGKVDVAAVLDALNAALSEEWMSYYQYWSSAKTVKGTNRSEIQSIFNSHAEDELQHASMIIDRILELEGVPVMLPQQWSHIGRCVYEQPTSFNAEYLVKLIRTSEECAMSRYSELIELTEGKDIITCSMVKHILADEAQHEQDMQNYLDDIDSLRECLIK
jgi:bacterioferritin